MHFDHQEGREGVIIQYVGGPPVSYDFRSLGQSTTTWRKWRNIQEYPHFLIPMLTLTADYPECPWHGQEKEYQEKFCNPMYTAQRGFVDDIIDPAKTRKLICRHLEVRSSNNNFYAVQQPSSTYMPCLFRRFLPVTIPLVSH